MDAQLIFNRAYTGVLGQGCASVLVRTNPALGSRCAYRGDNGAKCAIGHLIDDATAVTWDNLDGSSIDSLVADDDPLLEPWMIEHSDLLSDMQQAHDASYPSSTFIDDFKHRMQNVANRYCLEVPE